MYVIFRVSSSFHTNSGCKYSKQKHNMLNFLRNILNPGILWRHNHIRALSTCNTSIYGRVGEKEVALAH